MEDIDALKERCTKQAYTFLVDSRSRDYIANPTPSSYVVDFTTPFHNVIGLEVIEASIPRTMYNIDVTNNTLFFYVYDVSTPQPAPNDFVQVTMETGDYTIQTLVTSLNSVLLNAARVNGDQNRELVSLTIESISSPPETKSKVRFKCPYAFILDMNRSTLAETLGYDLYSASQNSLGLGPRTFMSSLESSALAVSYNVFTGPVAISLRIPVRSQPIAQKIQLNSPFYIKGFDIAAFTTSSQPTTIKYSLYNAVGNGTIATAYASIGNRVATGSIGISFSDGRMDTLELAQALLLPKGNYWVVLEDPNPSAMPDPDIAVYYNDVPIQLSTIGATPTLFACTSIGGNTWSAVDPDLNDDVQYNACINVIGSDPYHKLDAPGLYSLTGERYIRLRCQEIEENSYRSLAYGRFNLGIAKFRTTGAPDQENQQGHMHMTTLVGSSMREFHPIGKLSRITLRFETSVGELYDFKGVNHTITFLVRYLEVARTAPWRDYLLNQNYKGDMMEYRRTQQEQEESDTDGETDDSDADHEDTNRNQDWVSKYRYHEKLYGNGGEGISRDRQAAIMSALEEKEEESKTYMPYVE